MRWFATLGRLSIAILLLLQDGLAQQWLGSGYRDPVSGLNFSVLGQPKTPPPTHLQFSRSGSLLCAARWGAHKVVLWDVNRRQKSHEWIEKGLGGGARAPRPIFSTDDSEIFVTSYHRQFTRRPPTEDGEIKWRDDSRGNIVGLNVRTGEIRRLGSVDGDLQSLAISPEGREIAAGDGEGRVHVWDTSTGALTRSSDRQGTSIISLSFSPDGNEIWAMQLGGDHLWLDSETLEVRTRQHLATPAEGQACGSGTSVQFISMEIAEYSQGGGLLALNPLFGPTDLWDLASKRTLKVIYGGRAMALRRVGSRYLAATEGADGQIGLWRGVEAKKPLLLGEKYWLKDVAISPDGTLLGSTATGKYGIRLWDLAP